MSDQMRQPSADPSHLSPSQRRFDAIYAFAEKQSTTIMPAPQGPKPQQKGPDEPNTDPLSNSHLQQDQDKTVRLPSARLLPERYRSRRLPDRKALREPSRAMGLHTLQQLPGQAETARPPDQKPAEVDKQITLKMPVLQARKADFLKHDAWLQQLGTPGSSIDDPDIYKYDTIPMLILKGLAQQQGQPAPVMQSELTGAASSAAIVGAGNLAGSVIKYGSNLLIQRGFGRNVYGMYSISYALVSIIAGIFNLGLDDAMIRYTATYRANKKRQALGGLAVFCTVTAGLVGLAGAILVATTAPFLAHLRGDPRLMPVLQFMSPLVPMLCMQIIWYSGLQGFKAFKWRVIAERIISPAVMIVALVAILFLWHNIFGIALATIIGVVASMTFSLYALLRLLPRESKSRQRQYEFREWLGFGIPNFLTSIVDMTLESTDTLLLAFFAISNGQIGLYMAAIKLSGFIVMPQSSLNAMFAPTIAELHTLGEHGKLAIMFKVVTKWSIMLSLPIFCVVVLFSKPLLAISSNDFVAAWPLLIAFALGNMINTSSGSVGYLLMMTGHQRISVFNSLTAVSINVAVGVALTPTYGAMGVAISTGLAIAAVNLMKLLQVRLFLKMHPYQWGVCKPVAAGLISSILVGILLHFLGMLRVILLLQLLFIPVFLVSYVVLIMLFKLGQEDRIVFDALRKKLKRARK